MLMRPSDLSRFYMSLAAGALMWMAIGASMPLIVTGNNYLAVAALCTALMCWPFRLKFQFRKIKADSFEDAMRKILESEKGGR